MRLFLGLTCVFAITFSFGQLIPEKKEKYPSEFALNARYTLDNGFVGPQIYTVQNDSLFSNLNVLNGFSIGGILRKNFEERFALEYGLLYTSRKYASEMSFTNQTLGYSDEFRFITYAMPVTGLVFVKLSPEIFANVGLGLVGTYKPSNVEKEGNPADNHRFAMGGLARPKFGLDLGGQFGFEYRTRDAGTFYLGSSIGIGVSPLFIYLATYRKEGNASQLFTEIRSNSLSIDLRWYLPIIQNRGEQPNEGPITQ